MSRNGSGWLVSLGAALFVLVPRQAGMDAAELSRVMQGVIAGVGFLCAGTILKFGGDHPSATTDRVKGPPRPRGCG